MDANEYDTTTNTENRNMDASEEENVSSVTSSGKREDYIEWEEYFMALAMVASMRSKDPECQVGACIANSDNVVVGMGYNGFPYGCSDDKFSWIKEENSMNNKHLYVCHAEMNAILNKNLASAKGCTIYVTLFPCNECAKFIIQSGIKKVVYFKKKTIKKPQSIFKAKATEKMFNESKVTIKQFEPSDKWKMIGRSFC